MANHKSSKKRARQTIIKTIRNRAVKSQVRSAVRSFREAMEAGDLEIAKTKLLTQPVSSTEQPPRVLCTSAQHHDVSRLATQLHGASAK